MLPLDEVLQSEFTDPSMEDHIFKGKFERFQESWNKKFGWDLFLPLAENDEHYLKKTGSL